MKALYFAVAVIVAGMPSALAQVPQTAPTRVEFTRPGGTPGMARATIRPSEMYMIAPAQPETVIPRKKRRAR